LAQRKSTEQVATVEPEQRTDAEIASDLDWLRELRETTRRRFGHRVGGHDAHLDEILEATR
jgi:hypothetical protein